jgi:hypothetical protein
LDKSEGSVRVPSKLCLEDRSAGKEGAFDDAYWMRFSPQLAIGFLVRYVETGETAEQKLVHAPGRGRARLPL